MFEMDDFEIKAYQTEEKAKTNILLIGLGAFLLWKVLK